MKLRMNSLWSIALWLGLVSGLSAQTPGTPQASQEKPTFKVQVDLVTTDVIVRDGQGQFVADLVRNDFEVYEDDVKQDITSVTLVHGGRVQNVLAPPPPAVIEGVILPSARPRNAASGRILLFFVDDLHLEFNNTPRIRDLLKRITKTLLHDGDMYGVVSSGPSSIALDMTYDRSRMDEVIKKIAGNGLKPIDIINGPQNADGPSEVRHRAQVAFSTVADILHQLEGVHDRRKAFIYVSEGYDFNPYSDSRLGIEGHNYGMFTSRVGQKQQDETYVAQDPNLRRLQEGQQFSDAALARELFELTQTANRANATMYTIDPRGLVAGTGDVDGNINPTEWMDYVRKSQDSLRVLAEQTGGFAVVNRNDMDKALRQIDAETSDYYVLGYYSKNPDALQRIRRIDVRVARKDLEVWSRKQYSLRPPPAPGPSPQK
jgi:VWFA-related protein